jgi:hypothetical protein
MISTESESSILVDRFFYKPFTLRLLLSFWHFIPNYWISLLKAD